MHCVTLNGGSFIVQIGGTTRTFTIKSFNYHKLKKAIKDNIGEEAILALMELPMLYDGILELYINKEGFLSTVHYRDLGPPTYTSLKGKGLADERILKSEFLGTYPGLKEIQEDWPEHFV